MGAPPPDWTPGLAAPLPRPRTLPSGEGKWGASLWVRLWAQTPEWGLLSPGIIRFGGCREESCHSLIDPNSDIEQQRPCSPKADLVSRELSINLIRRLWRGQNMAVDRVDVGAITICLMIKSAMAVAGV